MGTDQLARRIRITDRVQSVCLAGLVVSSLAAVKTLGK